MRHTAAWLTALTVAVGVSTVSQTVSRTGAVFAQSTPQLSFRSATLPSGVAEVPDAMVSLYNQTGSLSAVSTVSQNFEAANNAFDSQTADDFVVPAGQLWSIQQVNATGTYFNGAGPAASFRVTFYAEASTFPGAVQCDYAALPYTAAAGVFTVPLPAPCVLGAGLHWVSVQANMDFTPNGEWGWTNRTALTNAGAAWINPANGFGTGCTTWGRRTTCVAGNADPDQAYQLFGKSLPAQCLPSQTKAALPVSVYGATAVSTGSYVYVAGGYSFVSAADTNAFNRYDVAANTWAPLANVPDTQATLGSMVYSPTNNKIYLFGGESVGTSTVSKATRIYDIASNTWSAGADMPDVRGFMASGYFNGKVYLVAGYLTTGVTPQNQTWEYNVAGNSWATKAPIPHALGGAGFGVIDSHLIVAGGRDAGGSLSATYDYDIRANTWGTRANMPAVTNVPASAVINGQLWVFGGGNPFGPGTTPSAGDEAPSTTAATAVFNPSSNTWAAGPAMTGGARSFVAGAAVGNIIFAAGGYNGSTSVTTTETARCTGDLDFDSDGKSDRTVYRPSSGTWYTALTGGGALAATWGTSTDIDVMGDYDGDGFPDRAVFRPTTGTWFIVWSSTDTVHTVVWGASGDIPMAGDLDGDGYDDLIVYRPSAGTWYIAKSSGGYSVYGWGTSTDQPLVGDYDADGKADLAVFRPSAGAWYILRSYGGPLFVGWGTTGDIPVAGDWDGDGFSDVAIFRPSVGQWFVNKSTGGTIVVTWGTSGDVPVTGDFDSDGKTDFTIYRNGTWFSQLSSGGTIAVPWGVAGDRPIGRQPGS